MTDGPDPEDRARSIFERLRSATPSERQTSEPQTSEPTPSEPQTSEPWTSGADGPADAERPPGSNGQVGTAGDDPEGSGAEPVGQPPEGPRESDGPSAATAPPQPMVPRIAIPPDLDEELHASMRTGDPDRDGISDDTGAVRDPGGGSLPLDENGRPRHPGSVNHPLPRCLAVANQKGGVGKTTTTVNLGASLAELGYRVLVVDLDPQGNATTGLGVNGRNLDASVYDVILHDVPIEDVIEPTTLRNLFVVPATIDLAGAEIELVPVFSRELRLRRALEPIEPDFDFLLIDCPPSLGLLTVNALAAAGEVLVPIQCEYYALEGLSQLLRNVNLVKSNLNNRLEVSTIVLTMYDARTKLAEQVAEEVREHFGNRVCRNVVPRTVRLSEAPSFGQPVTTFDSSSRGAIAYRELAKEVSGGAPQRIR